MSEHATLLREARDVYGEGSIANRLADALEAAEKHVEIVNEASREAMDRLEAVLRFLKRNEWGWSDSERDDIRRIIEGKGRRVMSLETFETEYAPQIRAARVKAAEQWGGAEHDAEHSYHDWGMILTKHVGKILDADRESFRKRMIAIIAICFDALDANLEF